MCLLGQNHPKSVLLQTKAVDGHALLFMTVCGILWHFVIWTSIELRMHTFNKTEKLVYN